jgi:AraC family transcriptional regulator of adaptative response / DNA-3-methyladenine glycosylase II
LAGADPAAFGVPLARARTVLALSRAVADGDLVMDDRRPAAEVVAQLRALPGIGPWTASYIAMRALGDRDAFPSGDVALRAALERSGRRPSSAEVDAAFDAWRPWRAYAAVRLWHTRTVN